MILELVHSLNSEDNDGRDPKRSKKLRLPLPLLAIVTTRHISVVFSIDCDSDGNGDDIDDDAW